MKTYMIAFSIITGLVIAYLIYSTHKHSKTDRRDDYS